MITIRHLSVHLPANTITKITKSFKSFIASNAVDLILLNECVMELVGAKFKLNCFINYLERLSLFV